MTFVTFPQSPRSGLAIALHVVAVLVNAALPTKGDDPSSSRLLVVPLVAYQHEFERRSLRGPSDANTSEVRALGDSTKIDGDAFKIPHDFDVDPLYQGFNTHFVDLWMGCSTPQRRTMVVDTASSYVGFPCGACPPSHKQCTILGDKTRSQCFQWVRCNEDSVVGTCSESENNEFDETSRYRSIDVAYNDGTKWDGYVARDQAYTGGLHETPSEIESAFEPLYFGCQHRVQRGANLKYITQGILGMDRAKSSYLSQWAAARAEKENITDVKQSQQFSLCFHRPLRHGHGAGTMVLGGYDPRLNKHKMVYANMIKHPTYYTVWVERIYLRMGGGKSAASTNLEDSQTAQVFMKPSDINQDIFVIDSASPGLWFSSSLADEFKITWKKVTGTHYDRMEKDRLYTDEEIDNLPTILIQMSPKDKSKLVDKTQIGLAGHDKLDPVNPKSIVVALSPRLYMRFIDKRQRYGSSQIHFRRKNGQQLLGYPLFMGHQIHFDIANERIGFAESDCDSLALGNTNFNHTKLNGSYVADWGKEPITENQFAGDEVRTCGVVSCRTAGFLLVILVLLFVAAYQRGRRRGFPAPQNGSPGFSDGTGFRDNAQNMYSDDDDDDEEEDENEFLASDDENSEMAFEMTMTSRPRRRQSRD